MTVLWNSSRTLSVLTMIVLFGSSLVIPVASLSAPTADTGQIPTGNVDDGQLDTDQADGVRVSAPVRGYHVDAGVEASDATNIKQSVAAAMRVDSARVVIYANEQAGVSDGTVEVRAVNESVADPVAAFARGLTAAGYDVSAEAIKRGVTAPTLDGIVETINQRLDVANVSGGAGTIDRTQSGSTRIAIEALGVDVETLKELVRDRGLVKQVAHAPANNSQGYVEHELLRQADIEQVGPANNPAAGTPGVPVTLKQSSVGKYVTSMRESGVAKNPGRCQTPPNAADPEPPYGYCVVTRTDDEIVRIVSIAPGLAQALEEGGFERQPTFKMSTSSVEEAKQLRRQLQAGALPATLDLERANQSAYTGTLIDDGRQNSSDDTGSRTGDSTGTPGFGLGTALFGLVTALVVASRLADAELPDQ